MKEVDIFVRVLQTSPAKTGLVVVLYRYGNKIKELYFSTLERTQNRSIIRALIEAIEGLTSSCCVNLYTQNNFGFSFMNRGKWAKWTNGDIGKVLADKLEYGKHKANFIDCSISEEGKEYQQALAIRLRNFKS